MEGERNLKHFPFLTYPRSWPSNLKMHLRTLSETFRTRIDFKPFSFHLIIYQPHGWLLLRIVKRTSRARKSKAWFLHKKWTNKVAVALGKTWLPATIKLTKLVVSDTRDLRRMSYNRNINQTAYVLEIYPLPRWSSQAPVVCLLVWGRGPRAAFRATFSRSLRSLKTIIYKVYLS